ncbi:MAG: MGMT family protein [Patescibacteria group bacterium]
MTFFQKKVYEIVRKVPKGKTLSYREVAKLADRPRAWRAVGNILNKNCDSKIPCHRIIRSDGEIGGYAHGEKRKIRLLKKEGVLIRKKRIVL